MEFTQHLYNKLRFYLPNIKEFNHPHDYLQFLLNFDFKDQKNHYVNHNPHIVMEEDCMILGEIKSLRIQSFNLLKGVIIVGENVSIGPHNFIRGPIIIGNNSKIGSFSEVAKSIILDDCLIAHHNIVSKSILGDNSSIGGQTGIASTNVKHDDVRAYYKEKYKKVDSCGAILENNVKIGGQAALCPGCYLPENSKVAGRTVITGNNIVHLEIKAQK